MKSHPLRKTYATLLALLLILPFNLAAQSGAQKLLTSRSRRVLEKENTELRTLVDSLLQQIQRYQDEIQMRDSIEKEMVGIYGAYGCSVLGVQEVPRQETRNYGIVATRPVAERIEQIVAMVEKPKPEEAPSTLAVVGRYILTPRIFHYLENGKPGAGGEIQLTDGIAALLAEEQVLAYRYSGTRYDCGSKLGYLQATVVFGQRHPEVGAAFSQYLKQGEK